MTISKLKILGAVALACFMALEGVHTLTLGFSGGRLARQEPAAAAREGDATTPL